MDEFVHDEIRAGIRVLKLHFDHGRTHENVPHTF